MAYPEVSAPYGLKPINLIGGQPFAGSTREYPILSGYATSIYYGDFVQLTRGNINRAAVTTGTGLSQVVGVFVGCSFTNPTTKQKQFSQYYPASTAAGDIVAFVLDDPDAIFKAVVCSSGTTVASAARALVGQNVSMINTLGSETTGNSSNAILAPVDTPVTTTLPVRIIDLVRETAVSLGTATYASISTNTITVSALTRALPVGTDVGQIVNGQWVSSGSFVDTAAVVGATTVVLNQPPIATLSTAANATVFTQYPEVHVKLQFGAHSYYSATGVA